MAREFRGIFPYLVSPIDDGGRVREAPLRKLVDHLIQKGVHGLSPLGSTGEAPYLSDEQQREIVAVVMDQAQGRVPVVAGVCGVSTAEAVRRARMFQEMGVDGVIAILNTYFPLSQGEIVGYFRSVAESVSCPVVLYSNPRLTGFDLTVGMLEKLAEVPTVEYYKDASGNTGKLLTLVNRLGDRLKIFSASAHIPLFVLMLGGVGWMAGPACLIPGESVALYELAMAGRFEEALEVQKHLWELNAAFQKYSLAACIKAGLEMQGFAVGGVMPPQGALGSEALSEIADVLKGMGAL